MAQDRDRPGPDKIRTSIPDGYDPQVRDWGSRVKEKMKGLGFGNLHNLHKCARDEYQIGLSEGTFARTLAGRPSNQQVKMFEAIAEIFARKECSMVGADAAVGEDLVARKKAYQRYIFRGEPVGPNRIGLPAPGATVGSQTNGGAYAVTQAVGQRLLKEFTGQVPVALMEQQFVANGALARAQKNYDVLSAFLRATKDLTRKPTIRMYGNFTSLANSRQIESGSSDYGELILEEVALTDQFIRSGYDVRIIASLDVRHILSTWTSRERLLSRTAVMAEKIRRLEKRHINLTVGVDTHNRMQGLFILGNSLSIRARDPVHGQGYALTVYETDQDTIFGDAHSFDVAMAEIKRIEFATRKALSFDAFSDYFRGSAGSRLYSAKIIGSEHFKPAAYL